MSIANLPMYDLEPMREATDAWWAGLASALRRHGLLDVPDALDRGTFGDDFTQWSSPELLLSQTCGYPMTHAFADKVRLVAAPCYTAPYCEGSSYRSVVLVHEDSPAAGIADLRGKRVAVNGFDSQSGFNALRALVAPHARDGRFFGEVVETGHHHGSIEAVADGRVDTCATDCVTHALTARYLPDWLSGTRILTVTPDAPNLPYVSHIHRSDEEIKALQSGLLEAAGDPALSDVREQLMLGGFAVLPRSDYDRIDTMEQEATDAGYPDLT